MAAESGYEIGIVLVNRHEPEHEQCGVHLIPLFSRIT